ncbi:sodium-coupled monocarboxylate transporter 1-like [Penaeus chinensis]|uniref:sodium-coupled monocarboxylate transporter 1-like n=1 Tax=Penaeus chinensis TaxID=139456 RepID=UPI001FB7CDBC|nr:sodium-coupled monocarboxylate transporter 1-like [Penaeus chinensis]
MYLTIRDLPVLSNLVMTADVRFAVLDYVVFVSMMLVSLAIGVYSSLRKKGASSTQAFLFGGREMPVAPVAISLVGGVISAISILGLPTEMYLYGTQLTTNIIGLTLGVMVVKYVFLPIFYPLKLVSIYEYIELRFKSKALRKLAITCWLMESCMYLGSCLYAPSLALLSVTSLPTWVSILIVGLVCAVYISIGGVQAVVYTDVVQTLLMFGGVVTVVAVGCRDLGGLGGVLQIADRGGRLEFLNTDPSPFARHTLWSTIFLGLYMAFSITGTSQTQYQRFASVKSLAMAQSLCSLFNVGILLLWGVFYFSGLVAYAVYSDCDPLTAGRIEKPDEIMPYLVADKLSHLKGFFVASVYGGVLRLQPPPPFSPDSSLSSQCNAMACVVWEDLLKDRSYFQKFSDRSATNVVKILSLKVINIIGVNMMSSARSSDTLVMLYLTTKIVHKYWTPNINTTSTTATSLPPNFFVVLFP